MVQTKRSSKHIGNNQFFNALKNTLIENREPIDDTGFASQFGSSMGVAHTGTLTPEERQLLNKRPFQKFDAKQFSKLYENFTEKLYFAQEILNQIQEAQLPCLIYIIADGTLQFVLERLISSNNSKVRLICLDILSIIVDAYTPYKDFSLNFTLRESVLGHAIEEPSTMAFSLPDFEIFEDPSSRECLTSLKIVFLRMAFNILKLSFDGTNDPKLHNYSLSLLRRVFDELLPIGQIEEELERFYNRINKQEYQDEISRTEIIDIENVPLNASVKVNFLHTYCSITYIYTYIHACKS